MKKPRLHDAQAGFAMECGAIDMLTVIPVTQVAISASHTSSSTFSIAATRNMSCTPRPSGPHFDRTWVHTYLVELWNVHVIPHAVINRTNIPRERFNRELNAPPPHPSLSIFIATIEQISREHVQFLSDVMAHRARPPRHAAYELPVAVRLT
ncbi:hypothetical protein PF003_g32350 [Phytophthora fragariae]|nr:hypothetical protein PF003_g32350 [Phytophthora fragariae]KAE8948485.1 hypothetical protein PF009_g1938 [Phytophthora fragariae]